MNTTWKQDPRVQRLTDLLNRTKDPEKRALIQDDLEWLAEDWADLHRPDGVDR